MICQMIEVGKGEKRTEGREETGIDRASLAGASPKGSERGIS